MPKDYIILKAKNGGTGEVKIEKKEFSADVFITLDNYLPLEKNQVFKAYLLNIKNSDKPILLGSLEDGKGVFRLNGILDYDGVAVARRDLSKDDLSFEFWGTLDKPTEQEIKASNSLNNDEKKEADLQDTYEESKIASNAVYAEPEEAIPDSPQKADAVKKENTKSTKSISEALASYGDGGFTWQKVAGFYSLYSYEIVQYILQNSGMYNSIINYGYYLVGTKQENNILYISIGVMVNDNEQQNPFEYLNEFTTKIKINDKHSLYLVCAGIDKMGEFFLKFE